MHVKMINSVGEFVAGEEYDLEDEISDRFVVLGYAEGETSEKLTPEEAAKLVEGHQTVAI